CSFCPGHKRNLKEMCAADFDKVMAKVHDKGENFYLHLMGEPTAHSQFDDILKICNCYGIRPNITTNGTLLAKRGNVIMQHDVRNVSVSLHSFEANDTGFSLESYLKGITDFCAKALGSKTVVELRLWTMSPESLADKNSFNFKIIEFLREKLRPDFDIYQKMNETFFSMEQNRKKNFRIKENIFLGMAEQFCWPSLENSPNEVCKGFCYGLRNQIAVLSDGTAVPCCLDSNGNMPLGNIFDSELADIVNSERAKFIYDGFTNHKAVEPLCQSCGYMKKYLAFKKI
ncbi:MAG: SPASM domain-containing protein, partial [Oscillospiraceae bacterium]|nr:SPASM domain-containing protein [Oscillospiraceae bacterium]